MARYPARSASFAITLLGSIVNTSFTFQLLAAWNSLEDKEPETNETEWDSLWFSRRLDGVHLVGGLLLAYFASAAAASIVGFVGTVKRKPHLLKFYRDTSIADLALCIALSLIGIYFAWLPQTNMRVCESLSQQPELMRDLSEFGLSSENCERWCNRAVVAGLVGMILSIVAKLHFVLAVEIYYSHLARTHTHTPSPQEDLEFAELRTHEPGLRRIYLASSPHNDENEDQEEMVVYTRIPPEQLPWRTAEDARREATARWVTGMASQPRLSPPASPSLGSDDSRGYGQVRLPIRPGEGLFPPTSS